MRQVRLLLAAITAALAGEPLEVHGDGKQTRDFTDVSHVVEANLRAAEAPGVSGAVFNVAGGERHAVLDLVRALEEFLGRDLSVIHTPPRPAMCGIRRPRSAGRAPRSASPPR